MMFGNLRGWLFSTPIVALVGILIYYFGAPARVSQGGRLPAGLASISLAVDPYDPALPAKGTKDCDAAELYRQAVEHYKTNRSKYEAFRKNPSIEAAASLEGIDLLVQARDCNRMNLFAKKPSEVVNYANTKPLLPELADLQQIAVTIGAVHGKNNPTKARQYMEAAFVLGRHLFEERMAFEEYRVGTDTMVNAAKMLYNPNFGPDAKDAAKAEKLGKLVSGIESFQTTKLPTLWRAISGIETGREGTLLYAGEMFDIARDSQEPMWRAEALLKLGRMQYMTEARYADQRGAVKLLKQMADRTDLPPNVHAAAVAGRDLDLKTFRMYGGGT